VVLGVDGRLASQREKAKIHARQCKLLSGRLEQPR